MILEAAKFLALGAWGVKRIIATISAGGRVKLLMIAVLVMVLVLIARSSRRGEK
jgi:hypothetical protein